MTYSAEALGGFAGSFLPWLSRHDTRSDHMGPDKDIAFLLQSNTLSNFPPLEPPPLMTYKLGAVSVMKHEMPISDKNLFIPYTQRGWPYTPDYCLSWQL